MTDGEYARQIKGFEELAAIYGNPTETEERFGFVALEDSKFFPVPPVQGKLRKETLWRGTAITA